MKRPRLSPSEFISFLRRREKLSLLEKRRRRLYNRKYRKSKLFIGCWVMRIFYFFTFLYVAFTFKQSGSFRMEKLNKIYKHTSSNSLPGMSRIDFMRLSTAEGIYSSLPGDISPPNIHKGDTIIVERNIYDKPVSFARKNEHFWYPITFNSIFYSFILFFTFISFFFNDGLDNFTHRLLWFIWTANILSMAVFFFL